MLTNVLAHPSNRVPISQSKGLPTATTPQQNRTFGPIRHIPHHLPQTDSAFHGRHEGDQPLFVMSMKGGASFYLLSCRGLAKGSNCGNPAVQQDRIVAIIKLTDKLKYRIDDPIVQRVNIAVTPEQVARQRR